ncbi:pescadillo-like protein [Vairimorpha necatrix]|uniref:Pescadillo-like protein n=1 Tax=Vairimorpha necatrix TaxID=6039 RepID=A0AAX4J8R7_9MICR
MVQKYLKPHKKFISRSKIKDLLFLEDKEFDELVTLLGIFPYVAKKSQKLDITSDFYYKISDYEKIKSSEIFKTFKSNKSKLRKKEKYEKQGLFTKASKFQEEEYNFINLLKDRFNSFGKAVDEMSSSLSSLCLANKLELDDEIPKVLEDFKNFVIENKLLTKGFMSKKGVYYQVNIQNIKVIWLNPYNGDNLKEIIEIKKDEPVKFKWSELNFLDFASEEEDESSEIEYVKSDKLDVSLLSYAIPFQKYHLKLVLHKLNLMSLKQENNIFEGLKFSIFCDNLVDDLIFVIKSCSGLIDDVNFDICLGENFDEILEDKFYCHPQYVFDCLNSGCKLDIKKYLVGKSLPKHKSPFELGNFVDPDALISLSKNKRNKLQDIIDGFEDVHYKNKKQQ